MITQTGQYALRAMIFLADHQREDRYWLAREIGERTRVPAQYLAKVLLTLAHAGLVQSQRGRQGGFRLARPAAEINLYQVLEPVEHLPKIYHCLLGSTTCAQREEPCPLHSRWEEVQRKYLEFLSSTRLEMLVGAGPPVQP